MRFDLDSLRSRLVDLVGAEHVGFDAASTAAFAVDGVIPALIVRPGTQDEVAEVVSACAKAGASMVPWGGGTAMGVGNRPARAEVVVRLDRLDRIVEFDADNLCITVEAGMPLGRLQEVVAGKQEALPIDPPDGDRVTLGGLVAANQSGPRRLLHGTARDWVLGMRVVLPDGERIRCGGRVIKNVSGYDMNKLFIRSFGTLGIITEVTVKLLPMPAATATVIGIFKELSEASAVVEKVLASFLLPEAMDLLEPNALELLLPTLDLPATGGFALAVRLAGSPETVDRQLRDMEALVTCGGGFARALRSANSSRAWTAITNVLGMASRDPHRIVCKVAVPIGRMAGLMASARARATERGLVATAVAHAGSGILRVVFLPQSGLTAEDALTGAVAAIEALRADTVAASGSLVIEEAPTRIKEQVDAWGKPGFGMATMRRIKVEFDPQGLCSPGRFLGGI